MEVGSISATVADSGLAVVRASTVTVAAAPTWMFAASVSSKLGLDQQGGHVGQDDEAAGRELVPAPPVPVPAPALPLAAVSLEPEPELPEPELPEVELPERELPEPEHPELLEVGG